MTVNMEAIGTLARIVLDSEDLDHVDLVHALEPILPRDALVALCGSLALCPTHLCDAEICADDEVAECGRGASRAIVTPPDATLAARTEAIRLVAHVSLMSLAGPDGPPEPRLSPMDWEELGEVIESDADRPKSDAERIAMQDMLGSLEAIYYAEEAS